MNPNTIKNSPEAENQDTPEKFDVEVAMKEIEKLPVSETISKNPSIKKIINRALPKNIENPYKTQNESFDGIYSGFLHEEQGMNGSGNELARVRVEVQGDNSIVIMSDNFGKEGEENTADQSITTITALNSGGVFVETAKKSCKEKRGEDGKFDSSISFSKEERRFNKDGEIILTGEEHYEPVNVKKPYSIVERDPNGAIRAAYNMKGYYHAGKLTEGKRLFREDDPDFVTAVLYDGNGATKKYEHMRFAELIKGI